jgi:outer membrane protein insertion porin family
MGSIVLDIKNFSLRDWPRNFSEFVKLRSFHGAGQRLRLEAQPGTEVTRFRIDFVEPYLMDKPVRLGTSAYYFERGRDSHDERRVGANVSLGKRLRWKFLEGWYGEVAFRVESVGISGVKLFAPRDVKDVEGDSFLTSVKGSLVRDRTDSRMVPTKGDRFSVSWEQAGAMGGDYFFGKLNASYAWHKTLYTDVEDRKSVLTLRASGGTIFGDAPVFERFYGGGIGSMRGFEFRGISPRAGLKDYRVGGDTMVLAGAEYTFPLYADTIRGVLFTDMGTVEEGYSISGWRASVGFGIRLQIEFFGPVPMEFDLGMPIASQSEDDEQVFSFFIGTVF